MSVELSDEKRSMYAEAFDYFQTPAKKGQKLTGLLPAERLPQVSSFLVFVKIFFFLSTSLSCAPITTFFHPPCSTLLLTTPTPTGPGSNGNGDA